MIANNGKNKKYWWENATADLGINDQEDWDLSVKGSYSDSSIWHQDDYGKDWMETMTKANTHIPYDYFQKDGGSYPVVAVGDIVEVRCSQITAVVTAIGNAGMGDEAYQLLDSDGGLTWASRYQIAKVL